MGVFRTDIIYVGEYKMYMTISWHCGAAGTYTPYFRCVKPPEFGGGYRCVRNSRKRRASGGYIHFGWDWRISQSVQNADAFFTVGLSPCWMGNSQIRAVALITLLSQGICSLIAQEKQISPSALLVFLLRLLHYTMFWGRRERHGGKNEKKCMKV